jgi:acetylornithine deacetylase
MTERPSPQSLEMIRRLIGFDTVSRNSNLALIQWVQDYLKQHGIESRLVFDETGAKANLYATVGSQDKSGYLLSGHTDVVPIDGQEWQSDPFQVVEKDARLYGRGTSDMKSFVAVALAMVPAFQRAALTTPIHFAFSYDEEVGCIGVRRLITQLAQMPVRPKLCIVGEPTEMKVITAHKGKKSYRCDVRGLEAHSSLAHQGVNAVEAAAEIVARLKGMARRRRDHGPFDRDFDPPYTTVHTGTIGGGTALNIVPKDCSFLFEFRFLPDDDPDALFGEIENYARKTIEPEMHRVSRDTGVRFAMTSASPGLDTEADAEIVTLAKSLSGSNATGKVSFGTEAGLFQQAGIPTVVCGPGSIEQAHKPNEWVALQQIAQCEAFMHRLLERATAG